jgi:hypothetical protein
LKFIDPNSKRSSSSASTAELSRNVEGVLIQGAKGWCWRQPMGFFGRKALAHSLILVTRNVKDFVGLGVPLPNPWDG